MNRGIAIFFGLVLVLVAILSGGCSLVFSGFALQSAADPGLMMIWLSGFVLCALSLWGAVRLLWPVRTGK
jgi:hypothetical protein